MEQIVKTYGLIGKKLSHSFSAEFFKKKFEGEKIHAQYLNFELESIEEFEKLLSQYPDINGVNVTIPYKEAIIPFLDELTPAAKEIGAVNTIEIKGRQLIGHNTDVVGFEQSLKPLLHVYHEKALILGSGGAAKAVTYVLNNLNIPFQLVSRKASKKAICYEELTAQQIENHLLLINATPLGMWPDTENVPDIPYEAIGKQHLLYDLIYNPVETLFLKKGKSRGAQTKNGREMLELQALAAWEIWNK